MHTHNNFTWRVIGESPQELTVCYVSQLVAQPKDFKGPFQRKGGGIHTRVGFSRSVRRALLFLLLVVLICSLVAAPLCVQEVGAMCFSYHG